jgi:hypothetical protein
MGPLGFTDGLAFAAVERRVAQTRDMFAQVNKAFAEVLDELGVDGFADVRWSGAAIGEMAAAFDASHKAQEEASLTAAVEGVA